MITDIPIEAAALPIIIEAAALPIITEDILTEVGVAVEVALAIPAELWK